MIEDEKLLLDVLNSAPRDGGEPMEYLHGQRGVDLARAHGGSGDDAELRYLRIARDGLQDLIRGNEVAVESLQELMSEATMRADVTPSGVEWKLSAPSDVQLAARVLQAWSRVNEHLPGRLRACANTECNLYLIDHTRPGTAKWCSMATCGNRMKARAHAARTRLSGSRN